MNTLCPCGSNSELTQCCEPLHNGAMATTPEALMRARYTAFVLKKMDYIHKTTDPQALRGFDIVANREWAENSEFYKLEVLRSSIDGNKGIVEFKAYYKTNGESTQVQHHEVSKFRKHAGVWFFRDGKVIQNSN